MALTEIGIRKAKPKEKAFMMSDRAGLYLSITPSGGKLWRWGYTFDRREKLMALGKYPDVSLSLARERHAQARKLLAMGIDPMAQRKAEKVADRVAEENSFAKVADRWMEHWKAGKSTRHVDSTRRRLDSNILPKLGRFQIDDIQALDIVSVVKEIDARGARDIAKRALETTGQVFRYAIAHGQAKRNPAVEIRPRDILKAASKLNYARIDAKELPNLLRQIEVYPGSHVTRLAIRLLALTFVRTSELIGARWSEIDFDNARWDIPADRMKMRTQHIVPLARQTIELLNLLRELKGPGDWIFPGERSIRRPMSNNTILKGLERMGYKGRMTGHGFRGLASTVLHEQGYAHEHIELQLAHSPRNSVSAAYNHALYLRPRTKMMQDWADFLERSQRGAKVLPFGSAVGQ
jgi:integrase